MIQQGQSFALVPGTDHFVSVTLPSGKVETFDLRISPTASPFVPFTTLFATFVPRAGVLGTLQSLENVNLLILDPRTGRVLGIEQTFTRAVPSEPFEPFSLESAVNCGRRLSTVSTLLTLFVVPAVYMLISPAKMRAQHHEEPETA